LSDNDNLPPPKPADNEPIIRSKRITRKLRATIIHESGHVLACLVLHVKFVGADIRADNQSLGRVEIEVAAVPIDKQVGFPLPPLWTKFGSRERLNSG
jgi:hypothetical protein